MKVIRLDARGPVQTLPSSQAPEVQLPVVGYEQCRAMPFPTVGSEENMGSEEAIPTESPAVLPVQSTLIEPAPVPPAESQQTVPIEHFPPDVADEQAQLPRSTFQEPNVVVPAGIPAEGPGQKQLPPVQSQDQMPPATTQ